MDTFELERSEAVESAKALAAKLLDEGWGHDGAILIFADALFKAETEIVESDIPTP